MQNAVSGLHTKARGGSVSGHTRPTSNTGMQVGGGVMHAREFFPGLLVPDIAGWRHSTVDHFTNVAFTEARPDWVCEVLSPSTEKIDRTMKLPIYAREGVGHAWLVNPLLHTLEVLRLEQGHWMNLATYSDEQEIRAEPFDAIVLSLGVLWAGIRL